MVCDESRKSQADFCCTAVHGLESNAGTITAGLQGVVELLNVDKKFGYFG